MAARRVVLVVRDGWGYNEEEVGNAAYLADTPNDDRYMSTYPWTLLKCTGNAVGLPEGTQGGSEPGHLTMGAGRVVWQPLEEINRSIMDSSFYEKKPLLDVMEHLRQTGGRLHLAGLLSDQGIHGTTSHLYSLLELAHRNGIKEVYVHCFLDGRDVPERSAPVFIEETLRVMEKKRVGRIASMVGRYYAMDRDSNWDRTEKAYMLLVKGEGRKETDPLKSLEHVYAGNPDLTDYYVEPIVLTNPDESPVAVIRDGDAFILWNFRSDRARQITYALTKPDFVQFNRGTRPIIHYVCMSVYDQTLNLPAVFPQNAVKNNLGHVLSAAGLNQLRIAETEKYAHVTFFFNSQVEEPEPGEHRILVPSPKVPSYEDKPEMSAPEITERLVPEIRRRLYDFILVNFANGDLVGHSANLEAGIKACEVVDRCLGIVVDTAIANDYTVIVTGDHGNIETMFYSDGQPNPSHGTNPVPFILISSEEKLRKVKLKVCEGLSSIAPTVLDLMDIPKPLEMTGQSLLN
jgi:2,3-bisphosphoglycerate-independent phosphoglycerate mutase